MSKQFTIEQLAAALGYQIAGFKNIKDESKTVIGRRITLQNGEDVVQLTDEFADRLVSFIQSQTRPASMKPVPNAA